MKNIAKKYLPIIIVVVLVAVLGTVILLQNQNQYQNTVAPVARTPDGSSASQ